MRALTAVLEGLYIAARAWRVLALVVIAAVDLGALEAGKVPVHYSLYATCWTLLVSAAVGVVALWPMEIALNG